MVSVKLRPANNMKVFNPSTGLHLSESGEEVILDTYWRRRILDKEVIEVREEVKNKKSSKKTKEE